MTDLKSAKFLVLDTESTGVGESDVPVEVAYVLTTMESTLCSGSSLVNPGGVKMTSEARAVHHIDPANLVEAPTLREALKGFSADLGSHWIDAYAAHHAEFDSRMLPQLRRSPWLCTLRFASRLLPGLPHHGNQYLRYELGLRIPQDIEGLPAHRALVDAHVTAALLRHLLQHVADDEFWPQELGDLIALIQGPQLLLTCPFTKHKGKTWEQVAREDRGYLEWMLKPKADQKPLEGDMRYTIEHWLKSK